MRDIYIVLEDGNTYKGKSFGAEKEALGEMVFTTGMNGYIETLTDPSYYGQIVMQTFPLIGNYGMIEEDKESDRSYVNGYVIRENCINPSNFRTDSPLDIFLKKNNIVGVCGVDTRAITKHIREHGVMNGKLSYDIGPKVVDEIKGYKIEKAVEAVSTKKKRYYKATEESFKVTLIDYGYKNNILRELLKRGCSVKVVPHDSTPEEILEGNPQGIILSNGPGNPEENVQAIESLKQVFGKVPIFGICLGHQLMALAMGGRTSKLKFGHRGVNQPVKDISTGRVVITSQNHGYQVVKESISEDIGKVSFINANDGSCEGIDYPSLKAFSVQFHPEAASGPQDTTFLFDKFMKLMEGEGHAIK